jgi:PRA1 family protein 1
MSPMTIPLDAITSRFNLSGRFDNLRSQSLASRFANMRGPGDFFDFRRLSKPANFSECQARINYNLGYFSSNYAGIFAMLLIYALLKNRTLVFLILFVMGGMWGIGKLQGQELQILDRRFSTSQLYTILVVIAIPMFFLANPWSTFFWLVGASAVTILGHAVFMDKPIESAFSEEAV